MSMIDILILSVILISIIIGVLRGFTRELMAIVLWLVPVVLVVIYFETMASYLASSQSMASMASLNFVDFQNEMHMRWLTVLSIYLPSFLVLYLLSYIMCQMISKGVIDRTLGIVIGALRGAVIIMILLALTKNTSFTEEKWWTESKVIPEMQEMTDKAISYLPKSIQEILI